jgi:hypothetical protein
LSGGRGMRPGRRSDQKGGTVDTFGSRVIRAAKLDRTLYEEVEADSTALGQALIVVVLASVAAGLGGFATVGIGALVANAVAAIIGWLLWALVTYVIGAKLLPEPQTRADLGQLLRVTGFANAPGLLRVLGVVPFLYYLVMFITGVWILVAMIIAIREALDYTTTGRAVAVAVIGWLFYLVVFGVFMAVSGIIAA